MGTGLKKTAADFFAGIGLVELGLVRAGWEVAYAVDYSEEKKQMFAGHFDLDDHYHVKDVHEVSGHEVPTVTLAHASFPCTDVSVAGARDGLDGSESSHIWSFLRIIEEMGTRKPPLLLLENVEGLLTSHGGEDLEQTLELLNDLGYAVDPLLINASHFVPQSRVRVFIVGVLSAIRQDANTQKEILERQHSGRPEKLKEFIRAHPQIRWRLKHLPPLPQRSYNLDAVIDEEEQGWWRRDRTEYLFNQMYERHQQWITKHLNDSQYSYGTVFRRMRKRDGRKQSTAELRTDGIAGCLRTPKGGSARQIVVRVGKGMYDARLLNGRECARLMGAAEYKFDEKLSLNATLFGFGDAVCSSAIEWLALNYLTPLAEASDTTVLGGDGIPGQSSFEFVDQINRNSVEAQQFSDTEQRVLDAFQEWCRAHTNDNDDLPVRGRTYAALVTLDRLRRDYNTNPEKHKTPNGSSVKRLTAPNVKRILSSFGETRSVPSEAGRTSRGTLHSVTDLLQRLDATDVGGLDETRRNAVIDEMLRHLVWVSGQYHELARIEVEFNPAHTATQAVTSILRLADENKKAGAVAQHLVGAKLELRLPEITIHNHAYSTADVQTGRRGDFQINQTVFHVTVAPMEGHYQKCVKDVKDGYRVYLLVPHNIASAEEVAVHRKFNPNIEVKSIEQFIGQNIDELSAFSRDAFRKKFRELLLTYNKRVRSVEADQSLLIEIPENLEK